MIEIGKKAPTFTLKDQRGQPVALERLLGKWVVLYFYPKDDTPGCTVEACEFTTGLEGFEDLAAMVIGVSPDSPESHQKFIAKHGLRLTLLSDPGHAMMARYGAWGEKKLYGKTFEGVIRSTVLIDPAGKVAHHWKSVKAAGHAKAVRERLAKLSRASSGGDSEKGS